MACSSSSKGSLLRDQRGAIMVMGVFMAALLVGFLYYLKGLGELIVLKERMQDAADTAAFSSAVIYARGMNIIALLNIMGAAVLAAAVAARAIGTVSAVATLISTYTVALTGQLGAGAAFCGVNQSGHTGEFSNLYRRALSVMVSARTAANALRTGVPLAAQAQVAPTVVETYRPLVEDAFLWPPQPALPTVDASKRVYCQRAAGPAGALVRLPFAAGGVNGGELFGTGIVAFHALEIAQQMCEPSDARPALGTGGDYSVWRPIPDPDGVGVFDCLSCDGDCGAAQAYMDLVHDRDDEGGCNTQECTDNAVQARRSCDPAQGLPVTAARYQLCSLVERVQGNGTPIPTAIDPAGEPEDCVEVVGPLTCTTPYTPNGPGIVCETSDAVEGAPPTIGGREVQEPQPTAACTIPEPGGVPLAEFLRSNANENFGCERGYTCIGTTAGPRCVKKNLDELYNGEILNLPAIRVINMVHQCASPAEESRVEAFDIPVLPDNAVPQRLIPGVGPGSPIFQVWAVTGGDPRYQRKEGGVKVATWGRDRQLTEQQRGLMTLGRIGLAAAEYYYAGPAEDAIDLWVWRLYWRARLKRYRLPTGFGDASSCAGHGIYCDALQEMMQRGLDDAVVH